MQGCVSVACCWRCCCHPPRPFKRNAARRHHLSRTRHRVTNWPEHEAVLRRRRDLAPWLDKAALAGWAAPKWSTPSGQPRCFELAIKLVLTLRLMFHLALRHRTAIPNKGKPRSGRDAEAFSRGVPRWLGLALPGSDHTALSRRGRAAAGRQPRVYADASPIHLVLDSVGLELFGQGEWDAGRHGRARRPSSG